MPEILQTEIDRANYDIVAVITKYLPLRKAGKNYSACCPFHNEKSPSFTVNEAKGFFYCFGCGASGDAIKFVELHDNCNFPAAVESINGNAPVVITPQMIKKRKAIDHSVKPSDHRQDGEKSAALIEKTTLIENHMYLLKNNTAPFQSAKALKGALIVELFNEPGDLVNLAAITMDGNIHYCAGGISYGAVATLEPAQEHDGSIILTMDYAEAWRLWWSRKGQSKVICAMSYENAKWISDKQRNRFTHIGCAKEMAEIFEDYGHEVILIDEAYRSAVA